MECVFSLSKIHSFGQSMKVGKVGEKVISKYLMENKNIKELLDVRSDRAYQKIDVDYIAKMADGKEYQIEIKTDSYDSGNIYYETLSSEETGSAGCFEKTEADFLFYYFMQTDKLYIFSMNEYREWFNLMRLEFDQKGYKKAVRNRGYKDSTYTSIGYAYPLALLDNLKPRWMRKVTIA